MSEPAPLPPGRPMMYQRWVNLLFLHWPVPVEALRPLVPEPLEIDTFEGTAWIALVPFRMEGIRFSFLPPVPGTTAFLEINVRTYVTLPGGEPGVWFLSLDAANSLAVPVARGLWRLPYFRARMSEECSGARTVYRSDRLWPRPLPARCRIEWEVGEALPPSKPGEIAWFLTERYCLYAETRPGRLVKGPVHHPRWPLREARLLALESGMLEAAGVEQPAGDPMVLYSPEVSVGIWGVSPV